MVMIVRAGDIEHLYAKMLIFGDPGTGKTHGISLAPNPFILLTERNGLTTVKRANPDATVAVCDDIGGVREVIGMAVRGELPGGCKTLGIDGLTEIQRMFKDEIMAAKNTKDAQFSLQDWGTLANKMRQLMRTIRNLEYNVVATALAETTTDDAGVRYMRAQFEGKKTSNEIAQYFNGVAYFYKRTRTGDNDEEVVTHYAMFDGPSNYVTKACHPLKGTMNTDIGEWYNLLANPPKEPTAADKAQE